MRWERSWKLIVFSSTVATCEAACLSHWVGALQRLGGIAFQDFSTWFCRFCRVGLRLFDVFWFYFWSKDGSNWSKWSVSNTRLGTWFHSSRIYHRQSTSDILCVFSLQTEGYRSLPMVFHNPGGITNVFINWRILPMFLRYFITRGWPQSVFLKQRATRPLVFDFRCASWLQVNNCRDKVGICWFCVGLVGSLCEN